MDFWNASFFSALSQKKIMYEEVTSASDSLRSNDSSDAQSFKKLLEQISNYHVFMFRQYRCFFTCLFTGAFGKLVRGSFFYDHYIQVVIRRKKGITVVVKNCKLGWSTPLFNDFQESL